MVRYWQAADRGGRDAAHWQARMVAASFPAAAIVRSKVPHRARTVADAASMEEVLGYESPDSFADPPTIRAPVATPGNHPDGL